MHSGPLEKIKVNEVEVDFVGLKLFINHQWHDIEARQLGLLKLLIENHGKAVSRNDIMNSLWRDTIVSDNSVSQAITQLRRSLGDDKGTPRFIKTVPRVGYQLIAELEYPELSEPELKQRRKSKKQSIIVAFLSSLSAIAVTLFLVHINQPELAAPSYQYESRLTSTPGPENYLRYSPDGRYLAFSQISEDRRHMDLAVYDADTQSVHTIKNTGYSEEAPEWSPTGDWLVYFRHDPFTCEIRLMTVKNPVETWRISPDRHLAFCEPGFTREKIHWLDDNTLYFQAWKNSRPTLNKLTLDVSSTPKVSKKEQLEQFSPILMDIDKSSNQALIVERKSTVNQLKLVDLNNLNEQIISVSEKDYWGLNWHIPGQSFWLGNENLKLMSVSGQSEVVYQPLGFITDLDLNPVTKQLAHTEGLINVNLYTMNLEKHQESDEPGIRVSSAARTDVLPTLSSDGTQTAFISYQRRAIDGSHRAEIWLKNKYKKAATLLANLPERIQPRYLLWSPNGENLLLGDNKFKLYLINIFSKHMVPVISNYQGIDGVNWSEDGKSFTFTANHSDEAQLWQYSLQTETSELLSKLPNKNAENSEITLDNVKVLNPSYRNYTQSLADFLATTVQEQLPVDSLLPSFALYRPFIYQNGIYYVVKQGHELTLYNYSFSDQLNTKIALLGNHEQDVHILLSLSASDDGKEVVYSKLEELETDISVQRPIARED